MILIDCQLVNILTGVEEDIVPIIGHHHSWQFGFFRALKLCNGEGVDLPGAFKIVYLDAEVNTAWDGLFYDGLS